MSTCLAAGCCLNPVFQLPLLRCHLSLNSPLPCPAEVPTEALVLDVGGMKCGGCSAAVKRILLQQPQVQGAAVNLLTETAVVQVAAQPGSSEATELVATAAAQALTAKGFPSALRSVDQAGVASDAAALSDRKEQEMRKRCGSAWACACISACA